MLLLVYSIRKWTAVLRYIADRGCSLCQFFRFLIMTSSEEPLVNVGELGAHLRRKRELAHLSLRNVARETQISASTLSRIENGTGVPDTPTLARLARWLNIPLERIVNGSSPTASVVVYYPQESIPDILEAHLRADPNLTPDSAVAVAELFRVAYAAYHRLGSSRVDLNQPESK